MCVHHPFRSPGCARSIHQQRLIIFLKIKKLHIRVLGWNIPWRDLTDMRRFYFFKLLQLICAHNCKPRIAMFQGVTDGIVTGHEVDNRRTETAIKHTKKAGNTLSSIGQKHGNAFAFSDTKSSQMACNPTRLRV